MKNAFIIVVISLFVLASSTSAQSAAQKFRVPQVEIRNAANEPVSIPKLGEKHLLIFYADPDHASQNQAFTDYLEEHQINSDKIYSFGVVNLKDAPLIPNVVIRKVISNKVDKTGAAIYTDPDHKLRDGWKLGDVNNKFTIIFVTKDREIVFLKKGEMSKADITEFYKVIDRYR